MEMENEKLREKNGDLQRILDSAVKERSVFEERLAEMQLVVLKEGEQQRCSGRRWRTRQRVGRRRECPPATSFMNFHWR